MFADLNRDVQYEMFRRLQPQDLGSLRLTCKSLRMSVDENLPASLDVLLKAGRRSVVSASATLRPPPPNAPLATHLQACLEKSRGSGEKPWPAKMVFVKLRDIIGTARSMAAYAKDLDSPSSSRRAEEFIDLHDFIRRTPSILSSRLCKFPYDIPRLNIDKIMSRCDEPRYMISEDMTAPVMYGYLIGGQPFLAMRGVAVFEGILETEQQPDVGIFFAQTTHANAIWTRHEYPYPNPRSKGYFLSTICRGFSYLNCSIEQEKQVEYECGVSFDEIFSLDLKTHVPPVDVANYHRIAATISLV